MEISYEEVRKILVKYFGKDYYPLSQYVKANVKQIPYSGNFGDKKAFVDYCLSRLADSINDYLRRSNYSAVIRQREYQKYVEIIHFVCMKCRLDNEEEILKIIDIPIVSDPAIAFVKALHKQEGKTKTDLSNELGISSKMVSLNIRKLDPNQKEDDSNANPGTFRVGGQVVQVPISVEIKENGTKYYHTPNTMQPIVMQLNVYQTAVILDSLMEEYNEKGLGASIELAAMIWGQLSDYTRNRILHVWNNDRFIDFVDEIEEYLEYGQTVYGFQTENNTFMSDNMNIIDKLIIAMKDSKCLNIILSVNGIRITKENVFPLDIKMEEGLFIFYVEKNGVRKKEEIMIEDIISAEQVK